MNHYLKSEKTTAKFNISWNRMKIKILVAEDLEDSRLYLETLLENKGFQVRGAKNGAEALHLYETEAFDLVVTDIRMPKMDRLALLRAINSRGIDTPVIIISAYEELDSLKEALRLGACDYIAKPYAERDIYQSIDRASRFIKSERADTVCNEYLVRESRHFVFENNLDQVSIMSRFLCQGLGVIGLKDELPSLQVTLIEALNNAILHGNLEMHSGLKKADDINSFGVFNQMARKRSTQPPYQERKVKVDRYLDREKICYTIRDEGAGFDLNTLPDPLDPESFLDASGRGVLMIRTFCDEVVWNEKGNEIKLVKYIAREYAQTDVVVDA